MIEKKQAVISGTALESNIKILAALGPIGARVLKEQGVESIDPKKQYPYSIRSAIFDEVCSRFGEESLLAFGYENYRQWSEFVGFVTEFRTQNANKLESVDQHDANVVLLNAMMQKMIVMLDGVIKRNFHDEGGKRAGAWLEKMGPMVFELTTKTVLNINHEAYIRGAWSIIVMGSISDLYEVAWEFMPSKSEEIGDGWVKFCWIIKFTPNDQLRNVQEVTAQARFDANEALLRSVIHESEKQKEMIEELSGHLGKYIPPQIHKALFARQYDTGITTRRKKLTIFFSDIKNFTSTSEGLQPEDLTKYLNEYFSEMTAIALDCGATIDKYIGDAMMVFFGDPESKGEREDARSCVEMALRMQERMVELQAKWRNEGFADPFQIRMGMNTGYCNVGNFGSEQRLTYTIIGGEVNIAQRLEANADAGGILLSYETYAHAQDMIEVEEQEAITMKGINREIQVYSVLSGKARLGANIDTSSHESIDRTTITTIAKMQNQLSKLMTESDHLKRELGNLKQKIDSSVSQNYRKK